MKGKNFVKVTSILMIVGGSISAFAGILGLIAVIAASSLISGSEGAGIIYASLALVALASIIQIVAGVKGLKACREPEYAEEYIKYGIIILVLTVLSLGISLAGGEEFNILALVLNLMIPALYIYGLVQLKNQPTVEL